VADNICDVLCLGYLLGSKITYFEKKERESLRASLWAIVNSRQDDVGFVDHLLRRWLIENSSLKIWKSETLSAMSRRQSDSSPITKRVKQLFRKQSATDTRSQIGNLSQRIGEVLRTGMRLAITGNHLIAMVPPEAEVGDKIFIVAGCSYPVLLRQVRNSAFPTSNIYFAVVGASYLHERDTVVASKGVAIQDILLT
jgi:hypothetical protein